MDANNVGVATRPIATAFVFTSTFASLDGTLHEEITAGSDFRLGESRLSSRVKRDCTECRCLVDGFSIRCDSLRFWISFCSSCLVSVDIIVDNATVDSGVSTADDGMEDDVKDGMEDGVDDGAITIFSVALRGKFGSTVLFELLQGLNGLGEQLVV